MLADITERNEDRKHTGQTSKTKPSTFNEVFWKTWIGPEVLMLIFPKRGQDIAIPKTNMQQQVRGSFLSRRNYNVRGFRSDRLPQCAPNCRRIGQQIKNYN